MPSDAPAGLADDREALGLHVAERLLGVLALGDARAHLVAELTVPFPQLVVRERGDRGFEGVYGAGGFLEGLEPAALADAQHAIQQRHRWKPTARRAGGSRCWRSIRRAGCTVHRDDDGAGGGSICDGASHGVPGAAGDPARGRGCRRDAVRPYRLRGRCVAPRPVSARCPPRSRGRRDRPRAAGPAPRPRRGRDGRAAGARPAPAGARDHPRPRRAGRERAARDPPPRLPRDARHRQRARRAAGHGGRRSRSHGALARQRRRRHRGVRRHHARRAARRPRRPGRPRRPAGARDRDAAARARARPRRRRVGQRGDGRLARRRDAVHRDRPRRRRAPARVRRAGPAVARRPPAVARRRRRPPRRRARGRAVPAAGPPRGWPLARLGRRAVPDRAARRAGRDAAGAHRAAASTTRAGTPSPASSSPVRSAPAGRTGARTRCGGRTAPTPASPAPPPARSAWPTGPPDAVRLEGVGRAVRARANSSTGRSRPSASASRSPRCPTTSSPGGTRPATPRTRWCGSAPPVRRPTGSTLGTSVLTPTLRYHPSIIAQAFGTLGVLSPGRVFLGVGTGESLNETPATGAAWPSGKERRLRLDRGDRADPPAVDRGARRLRRRVLPDAARHDLRPPRPAGADLRRRLRPARGQARRHRRRWLHLHQRQEARAVRAAHGRRRGGRQPRPAAIPAPSAT